MPDIRYVCLSDLHFGAETSLLTDLETASSRVNTKKASPVLEQLVVCLKELISRNQDTSRKPTLVLNGDILELALAQDNCASMVFERFIDLIMPENGELFEEIIYTPGNHDHHLWETARETQYVEHLSTAPACSWGKELPASWHSTYMFKNPVLSYFLTRLTRRRPNLSRMEVKTSYPNFGLVSPDGGKAVVFHHGHLTESVYRLMSSLKEMIFPDQKPAADIWELEAENFAWIDFFWSTLGRSGDAGRGVSCVYEKLQEPKKLKKLLGNLAAGLAGKYDLPGWGDRMEAKFLEFALNMIADGVGALERNKPDTLLSEDAEKGLWRYMEKVLHKQIADELPEKMPSKVAFIFGHTHKPFEEDMNFNGYTGWVDVYNSGGWVVDTVKPQPLHGGAVILIDENLDTVSLRMYNEADDLSGYGVRVAEARHPGDQPGPFYSRIEGLVRPNEAPWTTFSEAVARAVNVREQDLRARINSPTY